MKTKMNRRVALAFVIALLSVLNCFGHTCSDSEKRGKVAFYDGYAFFETGGVERLVHAKNMAANQGCCPDGRDLSHELSVYRKRYSEIVQPVLDRVLREIES